MELRVSSRSMKVVASQPRVSSRSMKAVVSHPVPKVKLVPRVKVVPRVNSASLSNCHRNLALVLEGTVVQQVRATSLSMMVAMKMKISFQKTMEARAVSSWDVNQ